MESSIDDCWVQRKLFIDLQLNLQRKKGKNLFFIYILCGEKLNLHEKQNSTSKRYYYPRTSSKFNCFSRLYCAFPCDTFN